MSDLVDLAKAKRLAKTGAARMIRVNADLSLANIAESIGVSRTTIFRWERGDRVPHGAAAVRWVHVLDELSRNI